MQRTWPHLADPTPATYTVVDSWTPTINVNTPFALERTFLVPETLSLGAYYLILQLDYNGVLAEAEENNNEAFWNQRLAVVAPPVGCACTAVGQTPWAATMAPLLVLALYSRRRPGRA